MSGATACARTARAGAQRRSLLPLAHAHALTGALRPATRRWDRSDWTAEKHTLGLDFPNLPYWIEGALKVTQSDAILLHAAKRARLMGSTDEARARALMLHGFAGDLRRAYVNFSYGPGGDAAREAFVSGPLAGAVAELEAFAAKTAGPFLLGGACHAWRLRAPARRLRRQHGRVMRPR